MVTLVARAREGGNWKGALDGILLCCRWVYVRYTYVWGRPTKAQMAGEEEYRYTKPTGEN